MRYLFLIGFLFSSPALAGALDDLRDCSPNMNARAKCLIRVNDIHPTQFAVGMHEVKKKKEKIEEMDKGERQDYLAENPVPVVIGPKGIFYAIDHHHLSRAVYESGHTKMAALVKENWGGTTVDAFWKKMGGMNYVYLIDENGHGPKSPAQLPREMSRLADDPFRSIAGMARDEDCYKKSTQPFAEFRWAEYFRSRIKYEDSYKDALKAALKICHIAAAKDLPGYTSR